MATLFITHEAGLRHVTPEGHPEQVLRLQAVYDALRGPEFEGLERRAASLAPEAEALRVHAPEYLERIREAAAGTDPVPLDADTWVSGGSFEAALRAVGGTNDAVDAVLAGAARNAFVAMRPPGHHALRDRAMGFCLFSTVAIAAKRALDDLGLARVAVLDFDVHHGNGTQEALWNEARVMFVSSQQVPLWPGSGLHSERGAEGQILNLPLPPGSDGKVMRRDWEQALEQVAKSQPELVLVSAGFDAHRDDPLAELNWTEADFAWLAHAICDLADDCCGGRVVSVLEGGYDLPALGRSVAAYVRVLMERGA